MIIKIYALCAHIYLILFLFFLHMVREWLLV